MDKSNLIVVHSPDGMESPEPTGEERYNPFERHNLENLQCPFWSPSVFDNVSMGETPPQTTWNIHELAVLFPKPLEDSPSSHMNEYPVDSATEAKAQADIDKFFSNGEVAPSPILLKQKPELPQTPNRKSAIWHQKSEEFIAVKKCNAWTNTELSLPSILPLEVEAVLASYMQMDVSCGTETYVPSPQELSLTASRQGEGLMYNSVRRRLDLSFGETRKQIAEENVPLETKVPYGDPFDRNHHVVSPPHLYRHSNSLETSTTELEEQFKRCEFTPQGRTSVMSSPSITPIRDDDVLTPGTHFKTPLGIWNNQRQDRFFDSPTPASQQSHSYNPGPRRRKAAEAIGCENQNFTIPSFNRVLRRTHSTPTEMGSPPPIKIRRSASNKEDFL